MILKIFQKRVDTLVTLGLHINYLFKALDIKLRLGEILEPKKEEDFLEQQPG